MNICFQRTLFARKNVLAITKRMQYRSPITHKTLRYFCTPVSPIQEEVIKKLNDNSELSQDDKSEIETMYQNIDMQELKDYNPKLYDYLSFDPSKIKDFKSVIVDGNTERAQLLLEKQSSAEAAEAVAGASSGSPKIYSLPLFWKWLTPVFAVTSAWILKLQMVTQIPWLPFLVM